MAYCQSQLVYVPLAEALLAPRSHLHAASLTFTLPALLAPALTGPQPPGSLKLGSSLLCEIIPGGKKESYEDLDEVRTVTVGLPAWAGSCGRASTCTCFILLYCSGGT